MILEGAVCVRLLIELSRMRDEGVCISTAVTTTKSYPHHVAGRDTKSDPWYPTISNSVAACARLVQ